MAGSFMANYGWLLSTWCHITYFVFIQTNGLVVPSIFFTDGINQCNNNYDGLSKHKCNAAVASYLLSLIAGLLSCVLFVHKLFRTMKMEDDSSFGGSRSHQRLGEGAPPSAAAVVGDVTAASIVVSLVAKLVTIVSLFSLVCTYVIGRDVVRFSSVISPDIVPFTSGWIVLTLGFAGAASASIENEYAIVDERLRTVLSLWISAAVLHCSSFLFGSGEFFDDINCDEIANLPRSPANVTQCRLYIASYIMMAVAGCFSIILFLFLYWKARTPGGQISAVTAGCGSFIALVSLTSLVSLYSLVKTMLRVPLYTAASSSSSAVDVSFTSNSYVMLTLAVVLSIAAAGETYKSRRQDQMNSQINNNANLAAAAAAQLNISGNEYYAAYAANGGVAATPVGARAGAGAMEIQLPQNNPYA